jgi:hypothetical protein
MITTDFAFIGAAVLWILEKIGVFSWMAKKLHSHLPREKSMSVRNLLEPGRYQVLLSDDRRFVVDRDDLHFLDDVLVIRGIQAVSHYSWISVTNMDLTRKGDEHE